MKICVVLALFIASCQGRCRNFVGCKIKEFEYSSRGSTKYIAIILQQGEQANPHCNIAEIEIEKGTENDDGTCSYGAVFPPKHPFPTALNYKFEDNCEMNTAIAAGNVNNLDKTKTYEFTDGGYGDTTCSDIRSVKGTIKSQVGCRDFKGCKIARLEYWGSQDAVTLYLTGVPARCSLEAIEIKQGTKVNGVCSYAAKVPILYSRNVKNPAELSYKYEDNCEVNKAIAAKDVGNLDKHKPYEFTDGSVVGNPDTACADITVTKPRTSG